LKLESITVIFQTDAGLVEYDINRNGWVMNKHTTKNTFFGADMDLITQALDHRVKEFLNRDD